MVIHVSGYDSNMVEKPLVYIAPLAIAVGIMGCGNSELQPPPETAIKMVEETLHGVMVQDPYRWLEDSESPEVRDWIEQQVTYSSDYLQQLKHREQLQKRMAEILASGSIISPVEAGGRYFYARRAGEQDQPVVYMREGLDESDHVLLDPNTMSDDGTTTVDWFVPSKDGKLLTYGKSLQGTETSTLYILNIATGETLEDVIPKVRFANPQWLKDSSGFYYSRPQDIASVGPGEELYNRRVYFHKLGSNYEKDPLIFGQGLEKAHIPDAMLSADEQYLLLDTFLGWGRNHLYVRSTRSGKTDTIAEDGKYSYQGQVKGNTLYLLTNAEAPRYQVFAVDLRSPNRSNWKLIIPESESVIEYARVAGDRLFVGRMIDAHSELYSYNLDGTSEQSIPLPGLGTVESISSDPSQDEVFFEYSSFVQAPIIFHLAKQSLQPEHWESLESPVDALEYQVKQVFYSSRDETKIPMYLIAKKGTLEDGTVPGLLYGYGGFNIALTPSYSTWIFPWIEAGNVLAIANLRGGSEYGEEWHRAGMLGNKQNVFDDFIAAGEFLKAKKLVDPDKLIIHGRSNGGLLMGAAITQRPDLWRAVVCGVPLLDMLRYDRFRMAKLWVSEYGSAEDSEQFEWLHAYSPYHNVREGESYPATLIYTADSDSRVDPMHARKMVARLQAANTGREPMLLRYEQSAGHGSGKPLNKIVEEWSDIWSFVFAQL